MELYKKKKSSRELKCEWWRLYKGDTSVGEHIQEKTPNRRLRADYQILEELKSGKLFGYVQCDKAVPDLLKPHFANFKLFFKNYLVGHNGFGKLIKQYAEEGA